MTASNPATAAPRVISITVIWEEKQMVLSSPPHAYRSLMAFLFDELNLDGFGECKGMGRCGTCQVRIGDNGQALKGQYEGNEENTLGKLGVTDPDIRLSCKLLLDSSLEGLVFVLMPW